MIVRIQHKGLKLLWAEGNGAKLPQDQVGKIRHILTLLHAATKVTDIEIPGICITRAKRRPGQLLDCYF